MTTQEYNEYKKVALKICKNDERTEDLFHDVLIQLSENKKYQTLEKKQKLYFFIRAISNQYYSNNSAFYRQYRRTETQELNINLEIIEQEYQENPTMEWVNETLDEQMKLNKDFWYEAGIFKLYIEHRKLEPLHKRTQIPKYSLRKTINDVKEILRTKWDESN
jgi:DNA-directed RNA polymerase specialized sigma24 family protein